MLDTEAVIYQFIGKNSSIQERGKALEVVQYIKDTNHKGNCEVVIVGEIMLLSHTILVDLWKAIQISLPQEHQVKAFLNNNGYNPTISVLYMQMMESWGLKRTQENSGAFLEVLLL